MSKILDGIVLIKKQLKIWLSVVRQHATNFNWRPLCFLLRGKDKKNPADFVSSVYQPERVRQWNQPQHQPNSCLHPAHSQLLPMRLILWEPGTQTTASSRCQARALLLYLRHYLQALGLAPTHCLFIQKISHKPFPYRHLLLLFSLSVSLGKSCSSHVPFWAAATKIGKDTAE